MRPVKVLRGNSIPLRRRVGVSLALGLLLSALAPAAHASTELPESTSGRDLVLAGVYSDKWNAGADIRSLNAASGKGMSLTGTFHLLRESEDGWEGTTDWLLEQAWSAETTPVANVNVTVPAAAVASGTQDADILRWAHRVKAWVDRGEGRSLLIAPMQEMNGHWVPYGMDPPAFRAAYRRFVEVSRGVGLDETRVRWVFAPNAWSTWPYRIADYYPGDDVVDFIGISAYNFGSAVDRWTTLQEAAGVGLAELRSFAPHKPYLLTQVGSSTAGGDRDAWLRDLFHLAATDPNVLGLVYFNFVKETDWKLWDGVGLAAGWRDGMQMPATVHRWPLTEWFRPGPVPFSPYDGTFLDDDTLPFQADIEWLVTRDITQGCDSTRYCPMSTVTREMLATFLVRALRLPPSSTDHFVDDEGSPHEADINALVDAGITEGCAPGSYCPDELVTRRQLASLLARALRLPPADPTGFTDVGDDLHDGAIGALARAGITAGCDSERFCPWGWVNRAHLAAFLRRSLDRPTPDEVILRSPPAPRRGWPGPRPR